MYSDTVTLFNRDGDTWLPTVLSGVDLNADRAAMIAQYGAQCTDRAKLHVKIAADDTIGGKAYLLPEEWVALEDKTGAVTFRSGNDFDFFWHGAWEGESVDDTDYTDGFYNYMNAAYSEVYAVTSCARYSVIPHLEIVGK